MPAVSEITVMRDRRWAKIWLGHRLKQRGDGAGGRKADSIFNQCGLQIKPKVLHEGQIKTYVDKPRKESEGVRFGQSAEGAKDV